MAKSTAYMENLIQIINELQEVFACIGSKAVELPQIVVVGAQSSGKSSVLESLVGKSFLPRGSGLVTRCPIVLKMIHSSDGGHEGFDDIEEWCVFQHCPDKKFIDFDLVRNEIEDETVRKAGKKANIVNDPIQLTVYSPNGNIDSCGFTWNCEGDQPEDIEDQIQELILSYIQNKNSIILAVSAANNDIATSESVKYAKAADPDGDRTLAIITKLDLMDKGTDASDVLNGYVLAVKLGIIGVVNRSQQDINDNKSVEDALNDEAEFLKENYPELAAINGTPYLATTLSKMLMNHIGKCLPELERNIHQKLRNYEDKLAAIGGELPEERGPIMIRLITRFCEAYKGAIDGKCRELELKQLCGGAKVRNLCQTKIESILRLAKTGKLRDITDEEIKIAIQNTKGFESNLDPQDAFQALVKRQILQMRKPTLDCANEIYKELKNIVRTCINDEIRRFPKLEIQMISIVNGMWSETYKLFKKELETYIEIESNYVNTDHEDFIVKCEEWDRITKMEELKQIKVLHESGLLNLPEKSADESLKQGCTTARRLLETYFDIFLKNLKDHFRKSLAYHMIYYAMNKLQEELLSKLYTPEQLKCLMEESEALVCQRKEYCLMIATLEKAAEIIERARITVS